MKNAIFGTLGVASVFAVAAFAAPLASGLKPGEAITPFHPKHIAGPLAGTDKCFPCTFQERPQVQAWVNGDSEKNVTALAASISGAMKKYSGKEFKGMVVFVTTPATAAKTEKMIATLAKSPAASGVALATIDSKHQAIEAYNINTAADIKNTVMVYRDWKVAESFVNLNANKTGTDKLGKAYATVAK